MLKNTSLISKTPSPSHLLPFLGLLIDGLGRVVADMLFWQRRQIQLINDGQIFHKIFPPQVFQVFVALRHHHVHGSSKKGGEKAAREWEEEEATKGGLCRVA